MTRRLHELLLWLSTVNRAVLARCPGEEARFIAAGGAVATTTGMALLSGSFLFHQFLHVALLPAIALGIAFAFAIMNLERYVQVSIQRQRTWWLTVVSALPRLGLAYVMGLVLAVPLLLSVFAHEVSIQAVRNRNVELRAARAELDRQFAAIPRLREEQGGLQRRLHTLQPGLALKTSPEYRALGRRMTRLQEWVRRTANPRLVRSYQRQINALAPQIAKLRADLLAQEATESIDARAEAQARLRQIADQLGPMIAERRARDRELRQRYAGDPGLADRVKALRMLRDSSAAVDSIDRLLWLLILAIDSLPALLKTLSVLFRPSLYEQLLEAHDEAAAEAGVQAESLRSEAAVRDAKAYYERQSEVIAKRLDAQLALQGDMDATFIEAVGERLRPLSEGWARTTADRYAQEMDDAVNPSPAGPPADEPAATPRRARVWAAPVTWWRNLPVRWMARRSSEGLD